MTALRKRRTTRTLSRGHRSTYASPSSPPESRSRPPLAPYVSLRYRAPGGCYTAWCDAGDPWRGGKDGHPCGFGSDVLRGWKPNDIGKMLELYNRHSQPFKWPQFYSGYNELVYDSFEWNRNLPNTIEAFFVTRTDVVHDVQNTVNRHRAFLRRYGLTDDDVPLLTFNPTNWDRPFDRFLPQLVTGHAGPLSPCPSWCATWHCDGSRWCRGTGAIPAPCQNCKST